MVTSAAGSSNPGTIIRPQELLKFKSPNRRVSANTTGGSESTVWSPHEKSDERKPGRRGVEEREGKRERMIQKN